MYFLIMMIIIVKHKAVTVDFTINEAQRKKLPLGVALVTIFNIYAGIRPVIYKTISSSLIRLPRRCVGFHMIIVDSKLIRSDSNIVFYNDWKQCWLHKQSSMFHSYLQSNGTASSPYSEIVSDRHFQIDLPPWWSVIVKFMGKIGSFIDRCTKW